MVGEVDYMFDRVHEEDLRKAFMKKPEFFKIAQGIYLAKKPEDFLSAIVRCDVMYPPVWKVIVPHIDPETKQIQNIGANYYIVHMKSRYLFNTDSKVVLYFRGTYGYGGTGCYESAVIEKGLKLMELPIEVRGGDYLLSLLFVEGSEFN